MRRDVDLAEFAERFTRLLKISGLPLAHERASMFINALVTTEPAFINELYWCSRVTLISSKDEVEIFDRVFSSIFLDAGREKRIEISDVSTPLHSDAKSSNSVEAGIGSNNALNIVGIESLTSGISEQDSNDEFDLQNELNVPTVANDREVLRHRNFAELDDAQMKEMELLLGPAAVRFIARRSARDKTSRRASNRFDVRSSLRSASRTGGDLIDLRYKTPKLKQRSIVVLIDISGSMEAYVNPYLNFAHLLAKRCSIEVFTFATRLSRVTRELHSPTVERAIGEVASLKLDWLSGTTIASSFEQFLNDYGRRGVARGAVVLVFSDGWESGDPSFLGEQMRRLSLLAHKIIWANPRAANPGFIPSTGGMKAVLPYCDTLISGHSIAALEKIIREL